VDITAPLFQWKAGVNAMMDNIYFGTDPNPGLMSTQPSMMQLYFYPMPLEPGATYYWRVDTTSTAGVLSTGSVWSFTVMPVTATVPSPADGASWLVFSGQTLSWKVGQNAPTHDVYFGTDKAAVEAGDASVLKASSLADATFETGALEPSTTYYWRVDEIDAAGSKFVGDVWSFTTTLTGLGHATREIWENIEGTVVNDLVTAETFLACAPDIVDEVPNFAFDDRADNYGARLSAWLYVPEAGEYTFWVASDDASALFLGADPGKAVKIAQVSGWAGNYAWDSAAEQKSKPIMLDKGTYYIEALMKEGGGGDNLSAAWQGPAVPNRALISGGYLEPYVRQWVSAPSPADGATGLPAAVELSWCPGVDAAQQDVYFGTSKAAVSAGDASVFKGRQAESTLALDVLVWGATYYWRVDEVTAAGDVFAGPVWSFSIVDSVGIDNFDAYDVAPAAPAAGPLGWWKFDGNAKDSSGNGLNGTENGGVGYGDGVDGQAIHMDGVDDFVVVGSVGISGTMPRTIAGWVKADTTNIVDWTNVFGFTSKPDGACYLSFDIDKIGGANQYCIHCYCFEIGYVEIDLEWHHMAASYDGTTIKWYGDGKLFGSSAQALNTQDNVQMGKRGHAAGGNFPGAVDDVRIYNTVLSLAEIESLAGFVPTNVLPDAWVAAGTVTAAADADVAQQGAKSMKLVYDNSVAPYQGSVSFVLAAPIDVTAAESVSVWVLGDPANAPATLSLALEDSAGAVAVMSHPDPAATQVGTWTKVDVPLAALAGVDLTAVTKVTIGVGNGTAGGAGTLYIDDVRVGRPVVSVTPVDVTAPGDVIHGIPESDVCGGSSSTNVSPCGELPPLVIDNKSSTKYLNFKGDFDPGETASGFTVTPAAGLTIVTGMTFTSANDSPERDPAAFELYGSNDGAEWTLIAAGDIADFALAAAYPRLTKTVTPIAFANDVAYTQYKVLFTAIRNAATANSMQIAEVELLGVK
jgi:hypothetical protein